MLRFRLCACLAPFLAGCLAPSPPPAVRYFQPGLGPAPAAPEEAPVMRLRLRRVRAAAHLRERLVWREGLESGFYEDLRWIELPATYASRALTRQLRARGVGRSDTSGGPVLDAELRVFDEVRLPAPHAAAEIAVVLYDAGQAALLEQVYRADRDLEDDRPETLAAALGAVLTEAAGQAAAGVRDALQAVP